MDIFPRPQNDSRIGFHYFPDSLHYRESDLAAWLPELNAMGASWVTLVAPSDRAIPEPFVRGLIAASIEPLPHFHISPDQPPRVQDMRLLFNTYARWGVHYVVLFDRPNTRAAWKSSGWAQSNLVERFLDAYLPIAEAAIQAGVYPVFPPLEPGGDYWDTAFLRAALQGIQRRSNSLPKEKLVLSAYAYPSNHPLEWGAGGPERWPASRPYYTPQGTEDQRGFFIFDWYSTLCQATFQDVCPILLLGAGARLGDRVDPDIPAIDEAEHAIRNMKIALLMESKAGATQDSGGQNAPEQVLCCNFWLLAAPKDHPAASQAWFRSDGASLPIVGALRQKNSSRPSAPQPVPYTPPAPNSTPSPVPVNTGRSISHYLLLPSYEWGVADWHLEVIRPYVKKHRPTIGFSLEEASHAIHVTVIGGQQSFPETTVQQLRASGCFVERISGDGTQIASQLASL
jgi:hypothetical protein